MFKFIHSLLGLSSFSSKHMKIIDGVDATPGIHSLLGLSSFSSKHMKIIDGVDATPGRYNYTVGIFGNEISVINSTRPYCVGSLISPSWVLTAASCGSGIPNKVYIGRYDFDGLSPFHDRDEDQEYDEIKVKRSIVHPEYITSLAKHDYDFMLIELEEEESRFTPVMIDDGTLELEGCCSQEGEETQQVTELTTLGWGTEKYPILSNENQDQDQPSRLQTVNLDYLPHHKCQAFYIFPFLNSITPAMICARRIGNGICSGDGGGPLIKKGLNDDSDVLVGVASFNAFCETFFPSVFSRVSAATAWIMEHVDDVRFYNETQ